MISCILVWRFFNILRPRKKGRHFTDNISKRIFFNENVWILIKISLKCVPKGSINKIPALFQIMAWHRPGNKPLSEAMLVSLLMHKCVTRPQWVKASSFREGNRGSTLFMIGMVIRKIEIVLFAFKSTAIFDILRVNMPANWGQIMLYKGTQTIHKGLQSKVDNFCELQGADLNNCFSSIYFGIPFHGETHVCLPRWLIC